MTPQTLMRLYESKLSENSKLRLEYFFYTNSEEKAASLHQALIKRGYSGSYGYSASTNSIYIVTGWTVPIMMSRNTVIAWTETMCRIGFEHDAEFDGWGTNPEQ